MRDLTALLGVLLLGLGFAWVWPPLALIVVGAILLAAATCGSLREIKPLEKQADEVPRPPLG